MPCKIKHYLSINKIIDQITSNLGLFLTFEAPNMFYNIHSGSKKPMPGKSMGATHFLNSTNYSCVTPDLTDKP